MLLTLRPAVFKEEKGKIDYFLSFQRRNSSLPSMQLFRFFCLNANQQFQSVLMTFKLGFTYAIG